MCSNVGSYFRKKIGEQTGSGTENAFVLIKLLISRKYFGILSFDKT